VDTRKRKEGRLKVSGSGFTVYHGKREGGGCDLNFSKPEKAGCRKDTKTKKKSSSYRAVKSLQKSAKRKESKSPHPLIESYIKRRKGRRRRRIYRKIKKTANEGDGGGEERSPL